MRALLVIAALGLAVSVPVIARVAPGFQPPRAEPPSPRAPADAPQTPTGSSFQIVGGLVNTHTEHVRAEEPSGAPLREIADELLSFGRHVDPRER
jgi:hypothetical protein